jgi:hypothetical protein
VDIALAYRVSDRELRGGRSGAYECTRCQTTACPYGYLDNNVSERAIRVVAIGRKNFHGAGSVEGGEMLATLYSLAASCEAVGADPFAYFRDVIMRVDREDPCTLTPAAWVAAR